MGWICVRTKSHRIVIPHAADGIWEYHIVPRVNGAKPLEAAPMIRSQLDPSPLGTIW